MAVGTPEVSERFRERFRRDLCSHLFLFDGIASIGLLQMLGGLECGRPRERCYSRQLRQHHRGRVYADLDDCEEIREVLVLSSLPIIVPELRHVSQRRSSRRGAIRRRRNRRHAPFLSDPFSNSPVREILGISFDRSTIRQRCLRSVWSGSTRRRSDGAKDEEKAFRDPAPPCWKDRPSCR